MTSTIRRSVFAGLLAQSFQAAFAQADDPHDRVVRSLAPIEVLGQTPLSMGTMGAYRSRDEFPGNVQLEDDAAIERAHGSNLIDFMKRKLESVSVNEIQGSPFQLDLNYRGHRLSPLLGASQGLSVYLDGVRMNDPLGDVMNWDALPEAAIATLTMMPGSNPLYGLNTLGGALVLSTKSGLTHPGTEAELSLGSFGRRRLDFGHGAAWGERWNGYVAATLFDEDGWHEKSPGSLGNLFMKLGRETRDTDWSLAYHHVNSHLTGNGLLNDSLYAIDRRAGYTFYDKTHNNADLLSLNWRHTLDARNQIMGTAWYRRSQRDGGNGDINDKWSEVIIECAQDPADDDCAEAPSSTAMIHRTSVRQRSSGAALQWAHSAGIHRFVAGSEASFARTAYDQFEQEGFFDAQRIAWADPSAPETQTVVLRGKSRTLSLFASDIIALFEGTQLTLSGRWNQTRVDNQLGSPAPLLGESFTYSKFNPALGLTHAWGDGQNLFVSLSQGTRVPTSIELGCADPAQPCALPTGLQADPYLKQVVARTIELGARSRVFDTLQLSTALFRTTSNDDIVFVRSGASQAGYFANVGRTRREGVELAAHWSHCQWQGYVNYNYLRATYQSSGVLQGPLSTPEQPNVFTPGTPLAGLPRHQLKIGGEWRATAALRLGADLQAWGPQHVAGNESGNRPQLGRIGGGAVINVHASWLLHPRWEAAVRINNLADRRYESYGAGNNDFFPFGRQIRPGDALMASRFVAPAPPRALWISLRYEWKS